ncbi:MAG: DUF5615 family PIN-like protein [Lewinellaceae bacterium]|nr:DUF5615 family PIN-like protein [Lewinellaceae bacterium]
MKVLCDVHIAKKVVRFFQSRDIEAIHVNDILDSWYSKDQDIAKYADQEDYVVLSKDADFKNSHLVKGTPKFEKGKCIIEVDTDSIWINEG